MVMDSKFISLSKEKRIKLARHSLKGIVDIELLKGCLCHPKVSLLPKVVKFLEGEDVFWVA